MWPILKRPALKLIPNFLFQELETYAHFSVRGMQASNMGPNEAKAQALSHCAGDLYMIWKEGRNSQNLFGALGHGSQSWPHARII